MLHNRTKHIAIKYQYVYECVQNGSVVIDFVRSKDNYFPIIFISHSEFVMGRMEIPKVLKEVKTVEEDTLPCLRCSLGIFEEHPQL